MRILWYELFCCRIQKSDGGENMFLPSFMHQQSRVISCFCYGSTIYCVKYLLQSPLKFAWLHWIEFYNARDGSKRSQSQIQKDDYLKHNLLKLNGTLRSKSVSVMLLNIFKNTFFEKNILSPSYLIFHCTSWTGVFISQPFFLSLWMKIFLILGVHLKLLHLASLCLFV